MRIFVNALAGKTSTLEVGGVGSAIANVQAKIHNAIKTALSPRFIPNDIFQVAEIPRTLSGKKQELPIKKLMLGQPLDKVVNKDAMANPGCLDWCVALAQAHLAKAAVH